jgi:hypothetical protein
MQSGTLPGALHSHEIRARHDPPNNRGVREVNACTRTHFEAMRLSKRATARWLRAAARGEHARCDEALRARRRGNSCR